MRALAISLLCLVSVACGDDAASIDAGLSDGGLFDGAIRDAAIDSAPQDAAADASAQDSGDTQDATADAPIEPTARILFLGNSYTASNNLAQLVQNTFASIGMPVEVRAVTPGGRRLTQHAADLQTPGSAVAEAFLDGGWDYVVLQEQSQIPGFPEGNMEVIASREGATTLAMAADDLGAEVVLYQTWGRRDGDERNPGLFPDFATMQDRLTAGYAALATAIETTGATVHTAQVGEGFRVVHSTGNTAHFEALYTGDGSHPSLQGSYLAALILTTTIASVDPTEVTFTPEAIPSADATRLRNAAAAIE